MKAQIYEDGNRVVLEYDIEDATGEPMRQRRVFVGEPGHYVREIMPDGSTKQPCDGLYRTGNTLYCGRTLIETIRTERQRGRRMHDAYLLRLAR